MPYSSCNKLEKENEKIGKTWDLNCGENVWPDSKQI